MQTLPIVLLLIVLAYLVGAEIQSRGKHPATTEQGTRKPFIWIFLILAALVFYLATRWFL